MIRYRTSTARPAPAVRAGTTGLVMTGISVAATFAVAVAGPSVMEPALPGQPGQPPWSLGLQPSPYLAIGLTAAALAAGAPGLVLTLRAVRRGWSVPPWMVLVGGLLAAAALTLVPPFGSSDPLSYAAYGRMLVTGHNPYTTTPAQLAALGDPIARAVQDWARSPSVYGPLATAIQALAALAGGTSVRLTVFVLGLANLAAFAGTALLLQVLVAGAHVDSQAVVFGVAAVAVMFSARAEVSAPRAALAGALVGLGFAVKVTIALVGLGLALAVVLRARRQPRLLWRRQWSALAGLAAGFAVTAGAAVAIGGSAMLRQSAQASDMVSIGSPWRVIRPGIPLAVTGTAATDLVKAGAVALAVVLAVLLIRGLEPGSAGSRAAYPVVVFAVVMAWLFAWPYVLPWYDALAWALLALVPLAPGGAAEALGWIVLARTAALGFGYLPARQADATLPAGLGWLQPVIRHGVTPAVLAAATGWLVLAMVRARRENGPNGPGIPAVAQPGATTAKAGTMSPDR